eukprot:12680183-Prorocentrum_lima.AAC.1
MATGRSVERKRWSPSFASCRSTTNIFATACLTKGANDVYAVAAFASWLMELGHARMVLQTDGELAILT